MEIPFMTFILTLNIFLTMNSKFKMAAAKKVNLTFSFYWAILTDKKAILD